MADDSKRYIEQFGEIKAMVRSHGDQLSGIHSELRQMNETLAENTAQLAVHIKRTELAERAIQKAEEKQVSTEESIDNRLKPIEDHVKLVNFSLKLVLLLGGAPAFVYYVIKIIKEL
jgi:hypothetical protein